MLAYNDMQTERRMRYIAQNVVVRYTYASNSIAPYSPKCTHFDLKKAESSR